MAQQAWCKSKYQERSQLRNPLTEDDRKRTLIGAYFRNRYRREGRAERVMRRPQREKLLAHPKVNIKGGGREPLPVPDTTI